uniref:GHF5 endo-1,4-beta-glucanase n=1 Tax=Radopholus similis TaxID=46012 RepID=B2XBK9_RADSI|nr:GHF5 endo-1,4-beta-glucanase precursor [Radopholus similis]
MAKFPIFFVLFALCCFSGSVRAAAPPYGQLSVSGKKIVGSKTNGAAAKLHGVSLYWSQWLPRFWVTDIVKQIKCGYNGNVVRAAMAARAEDGGYIQNPAQEQAKVDVVVKAAIAQGIYVIVDWHEEEAYKHTEQAKNFFTYIAKTYGHLPNIIYELYNEPGSGVRWESQIKPYAETVIKTIRTIDRDNLIVVGTPFWDMGVVQAALSPIEGQRNIAYTLHFYFQGQMLRFAAQMAYRLGLPMFVTEYGVWSLDGDWDSGKRELDTWWALLDRLELSYCNWGMYDLEEQPAMLLNGTPIAHVADPKWMTTYGQYIQAKLKGQDNGVNCSDRKNERYFGGKDGKV